MIGVRVALGCDRLHTLANKGFFSHVEMLPVARVAATRAYMLKSPKIVPSALGMFLPKNIKPQILTGVAEMLKGAVNYARIERNALFEAAV